jgi:hypothetical protein
LQDQSSSAPPVNLADAIIRPIRNSFSIVAPMVCTEFLEFDRRTALLDFEGGSKLPPQIEERAVFAPGFFWTARTLCWLRSIAAVLGPVILGVVIFATLSPNDLRPRSGESADVERFLAYAALCGAFVFAYPQRCPLVLCLILVGAGALEAIQNLLPDRHGTLFDFGTKALGSIAGAVIAITLDQIARLIELPPTDKY